MAPARTDGTMALRYHGVYQIAIEQIFADRHGSSVYGKTLRYICPHLWPRVLGYVSVAWVPVAMVASA